MIDALPFYMLGALAVLIFSGLPVAVVLLGLGASVCLIGIAIGEMPWVGLYNIPPKLISAMRGSLFYPAVAMLLFMGVALEKAGIAHDMLRCLQLLLRRVLGGLVVAVLLIGVILARLDPNTTNDWSRHFELSCRLCDKLVRVLDASA